MQNATERKLNFEKVLKKALAVGKKLQATLVAEEYEQANEMTDEWGKIILSIFAKDWSEEEINLHTSLVKELLILQGDLTTQAENAREKLSKMRQAQNEKTKAANAYKTAGNLFSN